MIAIERDDESTGGTGESRVYRRAHIRGRLRESPPLRATRHVGGAVRRAVVDNDYSGRRTPARRRKNLLDTLLLVQARNDDGDRLILCT